MSDYDTAREDHEYLWRTYDHANDMTGGYVDSDDLKKLLESPTKATAAKCYKTQIGYWLEVGPEGITDSMVEQIASDLRVTRIGVRIGADMETSRLWMQGRSFAEVPEDDAPRSATRTQRGTLPPTGHRKRPASRLTRR